MVCFKRGAHRLGAERIAYLVKHAPGALPERDEGRRWFLRLDAAGRARVLATWMKEGEGSWGAFLLRHVPPEGELASAREAAYRRWSSAAQSGDGVILPAVLEWLPTDLRIREARRHLGEVAALAAKPDKRLPYAGLLPFAEAREVLAAWLGHPEASSAPRRCAPCWARCASTGRGWATRSRWCTPRSSSRIPCASPW